MQLAFVIYSHLLNIILPHVLIGGIIIIVWQLHHHQEHQDRPPHCLALRSTTWVGLQRSVLKIAQGLDVEGLPRSGIFYMIASRPAATRGTGGIKIARKSKHLVSFQPRLWTEHARKGLLHCKRGNVFGANIPFFEAFNAEWVSFVVQVWVEDTSGVSFVKVWIIDSHLSLLTHVLRIKICCYIHRVETLHSSSPKSFRMIFSNLWHSQYFIVNRTCKLGFETLY